MGAVGSVTDVKGSWKVPAVAGASGSVCSDKQRTWESASVWVGIDGLSSPTVEQTGTSSDCFYGQLFYYAWYEFYPAGSVKINSLTIHPGDTMMAEVSYSGGTFTAMITDVTTGASYTSPATAVPAAQMNSAEWVVEAPYYYGFLGLTKVTSVTFTGATATIGGVTNSISGWSPNDIWLLMVDFNWPFVSTSFYVKDISSALGAGGNNFNAKWVSSGP